MVVDFLLKPIEFRLQMSDIFRRRSFPVSCSKFPLELLGLLPLCRSQSVMLCHREEPGTLIFRQQLEGVGRAHEIVNTRPANDLCTDRFGWQASSDIKARSIPRFSGPEKADDGVSSAAGRGCNQVRLFLFLGALNATENVVVVIIQKKNWTTTSKRVPHHIDRLAAKRAANAWSREDRHHGNRCAIYEHGSLRDWLRRIALPRQSTSFRCPRRIRCERTHRSNNTLKANSVFH
ncbi:MAG: hypothetical protein CMO30_15345 [Tistrella sp.]|nr:hypothetical protein [Tistrella sp.]MBA76589.1 hypothetical protein [Tistrella sp.]MBA76643.1 hypothetical protein [Tistrella sp.]